MSHGCAVHMGRNPRVACFWPDYELVGTWWPCSLHSAQGKQYPACLGWSGAALCRLRAWLFGRGLLAGFLYPPGLSRS